MESNQDTEHLKLLSIFHYIVGGLIGLFSLFPLIHLAVGIAMVNGGFDNERGGQSPPAFLGWMIIAFALTFILCGLSLAACVVVAGRKLTQRKNHLYCLIIAGIECTFMPFGTVLGILTIVVLLRPSVQTLFGNYATPATIG